MNNRGKKREIVFDITTNAKGEVEVNVSIPHQDPKHTPGMTISTPDVISYLRINNVEHGACTQSSWLDNTPGSPVLEGKWVFAKYVAPTRKKAAPPKAPKKRKPRTTKAAKKTQPAAEE